MSREPFAMLETPGGESRVAFVVNALIDQHQPAYAKKFDSHSLTIEISLASASVYRPSSNRSKSLLAVFQASRTRSRFDWAFWWSAKPLTTFKTDEQVEKLLIIAISISCGRNVSCSSIRAWISVKKASIDLTAVRRHWKVKLGVVVVYIQAFECLEGGDNVGCHANAGANGPDYLHRRTASVII